MSNATYDQALATAQALSERSDDALFAELGLRIQDIQNIGGYQRTQQFTGDFVQEAPDMLSVDDLRRVGRKWWQKLEPELMNVVCDKSNEEMGKITGGRTIPQIAASLATMGLVSLMAPPAWLIVAMTLLATKIASTGLDVLCETWQESRKSHA
jgi:hypothetical protein